MDTVSIQTHQHMLNDKWKLYYHLPQDKTWDVSSYSVIMDSIDNAEKVIALNEFIHNNVLKNCMLFVMREGITPMWEDPRNRNGGCFSYKISNRFVAEVWKQLFYMITGETLCKDTSNSKNMVRCIYTTRPEYYFEYIKSSTTRLSI